MRGTAPVPRHLRLAARTRPPNPASRRGRGSGGGPPVAERPHGAARTGSPGRGGHAVGDEPEQRAARGLDASRGLEVGLRVRGGLEQLEVDAGLEMPFGAVEGTEPGVGAS